ncbi:MAG: hypothetical protein KBA51_06125 [Kiritimatiellae bacterium]|nr:hypothetical protein [Kiritimatiellia bacterium]
MTFSSVHARHGGAIRQIDLSRLPAEHRESGLRAGGYFLMVFSLMWGGMPTLALVDAIRKGEMKPGMWFMLLFTLIGIGMFLAGLKWVSLRRTLRFSADLVSFEEHSLLGHRLWSEPLDRFPGVRSRSVFHSGGKHSPSYTQYLIELYHPEPRKRLRLYESRSEDGLREMHKMYCRALGLPALEGEGAERTERRPDDLDKSVVELAREGKIQVAFDPADRTPPNLSLRMEGEFLRIELPPPRPLAAGLLIVFLVPLILILTPKGRTGAPSILGILGVLLLVGTTFVIAWQRITRAVLRVGAQSVIYGRRLPWGETPGRTVDLGKLESVRIGRKVDNRGQPGLLLVTDTGTEAIGEGQSKQTLEWLRDCILTVAARGR